MYRSRNRFSDRMGNDAFQGGRWNFNVRLSTIFRMGIGGRFSISRCALSFLIILVWMEWFMVRLNTRGQGMGVLIQVCRALRRKRSSIVGAGERAYGIHFARRLCGEPLQEAAHASTMSR